MGIRFLLYEVVDIAFYCYILMIFIRIIGSWFYEFQTTKIFRFICFYTDPYLDFFRKFIPPIGFLDISPIVAFFALRIIESVVKAVVLLI